MFALRPGFRGLVPLAVVAVAAVGCGGDDNDNGGGNAPASSTPTTTPAPAKTGGATGGGATVKEDMSEFKFSDPKPSVKAGTITFETKNVGQTTHALEVEGPGEESQSGNVSPGGSKTLKVKLDKPGKYEFYCPVDGHKDLGMKGEITVK
jgi:plastocyanin